MSSTISISITDTTSNRTISLLNRLFPAPRQFGIQLWNGTKLPTVEQSTFTLILRHPGALRRMFTPPVELSLGEAYIYGDFDVEGDIFTAFSLMDDIAARTFSPGEVTALTYDLLALPNSGPTRPSGRGPANLGGQLHSRERDRAAIQYHYDVGNDFYSLWLDRNMQYSCAYFPTGLEDLDTAQEQKMEHICRKLLLKPGERLLDIGCGWGGLALYAARKYGVQVLGVTLSKTQLIYASHWVAVTNLGDRVNFKLKDYRDLGEAAFDKIVSIGMFEHVGQSHLPEYFAQAYRLLKPGGLFLNHGISRRPTRHSRESPWQTFVERSLLGSGTFVWRYIFPDGELTPVSQVNIQAEAAGFEVRDVENLREHYALTLHQWVDRLATQRAEAVKAVGEATYRTWRLYMAASAHGFESGNINVNQTLLAKKTHTGKSNVPLTRADLYSI